MVTFFQKLIELKPALDMLQSQEWSKGADL